MSDTNFVQSIKENELQNNQMKAIRIKGNPILLVRKDGQVFALYNRCPHAGCSLEHGILTDYLVMCPCHGWKFDIRTGQYVENPATTLETYRCIIQNGRVYVENKKR
jgi:nitrite reductase/ring-hydroxylating ferredoxin subunit